MYIGQNGIMSRGDRIHIRCSLSEREAFDRVAELKGLDLSAWVRTALRAASETELRLRGEPVPFLDAKVKRKARKHAEPEIPAPDTGRIVPIERNKPSGGE
jgi:hypothetical protein